METKINTNEVKKELYKSKVNAKFSHYKFGNLYYTVEMIDGIYEFPIPTVEEKTITFMIDEDEDSEQVYDLSSDLGETTFHNEIKASELNRWIAKSIEKNEFKKIW